LISCDLDLSVFFLNIPIRLLIPPVDVDGVSFTAGFEADLA